MQKLYETLKLFYLGHEEGTAIPVVYENKDLTTHGLIIGMTGSGKTGLGIGLIEEATLDNIPSIIIDPKGDMGNLLLTFPHMDGPSFAPWVDANEAANKGLSIHEHAQKIASIWKKGIESFDQDISRVATLKERGDFTIYTPGSSAGVGVALISTFKAPAPEIMEDRELLTTLISSTVTSILSLVDIQSDPLSGKEHILVSSIFLNFFEKGQDVSLETLIGAIVSPPFEKVGVFALNTFYPQDKRLELAMKLNALVASPSFSTWLQGELLDIDSMLFTKEGKAKVSIFSIAHLNDKERMFFVTLLLNQFLGWMRRQEGSSRLRALLYMDEIFGFFPPNLNPPSKQPMLTMLKQARAFGVGIVLSTQNPVDLDYKGLSNIGTWFIGRLQTAQDRERVISGLQGIQGSDYDKAALMGIIANLDKRHFLVKNIHEDGLHVFSTRWVLSYLKGPLTRDQIASLMEAKKNIKHTQKPQNQSHTPKPRVIPNTLSIPPILSDAIPQTYHYFSQSEGYIMAPYLACEGEVAFVDTKLNINETRRINNVVMLDEKMNEISWSDIQLIELLEPQNKPRNGSTYGKLPLFIQEMRSFSSLTKDWQDYLYRNERLDIFANSALKIFGDVGMSEEAFNLRVHDALENAYEEEKVKQIAIYEKDELALEKKLRTLEARLDKEKADVSSKTTNMAITIGTSLLSALLGGNLLSKTNASKVGTSARSASSVLKEKRDVARVESEIEELLNQMEELKEKLALNLESIKASYDIRHFPNETYQIKPRRADIYDAKLRIAWVEE
jgi:hypothetical protein